MPYFDHNATTPLSSVARHSWMTAADEAWQNPSSLYREAARVKVRLEAAREQLASVLGIRAEQIIFNSGATEGAASIIAHWAQTWPESKFLALGQIEHPAVLEAAKRYFGKRILFLNTDFNGQVSLDALADAVKSSRVGGVAVMAANNETGVIQPWREIGRLCSEMHLPYFCDATQWLGKMPAAELGNVDAWMVGSAHKFGGPKGVGFLKLGTQAGGFSGLPGGGQENGRRGGTENFPGIVAMVDALEELERNQITSDTIEERQRWRIDFEDYVLGHLPGVRVVGAVQEDRAQQLWNTVSLVMPYSDNHRWVALLDKRGFQVSTGSACASGSDKPSHVLAAMGIPLDEARRTIRVSSGWETSSEAWRDLGGALVKVALELDSGGQTRG